MWIITENLILKEYQQRFSYYRLLLITTYGLICSSAHDHLLLFFRRDLSSPMVVRWLELPFVRADFDFGGPSEDGFSAKIWEPVQNRGSFLGRWRRTQSSTPDFFRTGPHFGVTAGVALTATSAETTTPNLSPAAKRTLNHSYNVIPARQRRTCTTCPRKTTCILSWHQFLVHPHPARNTRLVDPKARKANKQS
jgi:hypothetical protein